MSDRRIARLVRHIQDIASLADAEGIISESSYRRPECVQAYLDRCESLAFENPRIALTLAEAAPGYVEAAAPDHVARSQVVLGNAYRRSGRERSAEEAFRKAQPRAAFDQAELLTCWALLRHDQREFGRARQMAEEAVAIHGEGLPGPPDRGLPAALVVLGMVHHTGHWMGTAGCELATAGRCYHRALSLADPRSAPRSHFSAIHNLGVLALETPSGLTETLRTTGASLKALRAMGVKSRSAPAARVRWVQTLAEIGLFGFIRRAEGRLCTARRHLQAAGADFDAVLLGLDLGCHYLEAGRWEDLRRISADIYRLDWDGIQREKLAALTLWRQGCMEELLSAETLRYVLTTVRGVRSGQRRV